MNELDLIKNQIREMEEFRTNLERQQLTYPIDVDSMNEIRGDAYVYIGDVMPFSLVTYDEPTEIIVGNKRYLLYMTQYADLSI